MDFVSGACPSLQFVPPINPYYSLDFLLDPMSEDLVLQPDGTFAMATGAIKLTQDIKLFLLSPVGTSIQDSKWGNAALTLIGSAPLSLNAVTSSIRGALFSLQRYKQQEQQTRGYPLEGTELISSIVAANITQVQGNANAFNVQIDAIDGASGSQNINIVLS